MTKADVKRVKEIYPAGSKIRCIEMDDPYVTIPSGTEGVVECVDDIGTIHVSWKTGSSLGIIPGVDRFEKV